MEELIYSHRLKEPTVIKQVVERKEVKNTVETGTMLGVALAVVISYVKWNSIGWAILHGALNWVYVIYFAIRYL